MTPQARAEALPWTMDDMKRLAHVLLASKMTLGQLLDEMAEAAALQAPPVDDARLRAIAERHKDFEARYSPGPDWQPASQMHDDLGYLLSLRASRPDAPPPDADKLRAIAESLHWEVYVTGSMIDEPVAAFQFEDHANTWARREYPGRSEVRALASRPDGASDSSQRGRTRTPAGLTAMSATSTSTAAVPSREAMASGEKEPVSNPADERASRPDGGGVARLRGALESAEIVVEYVARNPILVEHDGQAFPVNSALVQIRAALAEIGRGTQG